MTFDGIMHSGPVALFVLALLLLFSVTSWAIIILKFLTLKRASQASNEFNDVFWKLRRFDEVFEATHRYPNSPLAQIFIKGYQELMRIKKDEKQKDSAEHLGVSNIESVEHALRKISMAQMTQMESLVPFLATVGSTSPFIGLFGTVVGIMASFHEIGQQGSASLATVAPGIAEALIATAAGLLAAIPAVIAYNYFSVRIRSLGQEMETFSSDFINIIKRHYA
jgi:biopolymer transport protein TolQ